MSIKHIETKSDTGRSGIRVEYDSSMGIVRLSGFYDTYVKLRLKKTEWSLKDFLELLGIKENSVKNDKQTELVQPEKSLSLPKTKRKKSTNDLIDLSDDTDNSISNSDVSKKSFDFDRIPKVLLSFTLKKTTETSKWGSISVNISTEKERLRFIIPNGSGFPMDLFNSDTKKFNTKNKNYKSLEKVISNFVSHCEEALKERNEWLKNSKNSNPKDTLTFVRDYCLNKAK